MAPHRTTVRRLTNAPLVMVLCDVRFSPVLTMESHVADIQDLLRRSGYPGYDRAAIQQLVFQIDEPPKFTSDTRWLFRSRDRNRVASLSTSSITLQVTDYSNFEAFLADVQTVLDAVRQHAQPALHERIGLRYVNAVENAGKDLARLFKESVLSFTADELGVSSLLTAQHAVGKTERGQVVLRMNQVENTPLLPVDLLSPEFPELSRARDGVHALLDIDGSDLETDEFSSERIIERLWAIHEYTERGFWKSTTSDAHKEWGLVETEVTR